MESELKKATGARCLWTHACQIASNPTQHTHSSKEITTRMALKNTREKESVCMELEHSKTVRDTCGGANTSEKERVCMELEYSKTVRDACGGANTRQLTHTNRHSINTIFSMANNWEVYWPAECQEGV